eukprot:GILI01016445.1.p1 GENE.GILI01016445.1~~GILI01016445.1.p1  ORF type:complete len:301 (-),score=70.80 GILI01016445.1:289-1191(-)
MSAQEQTQEVPPQEQVAPKPPKVRPPKYEANLPFFLRVAGTIFAAGTILTGWIITCAAQYTYKLLAFPFTNAVQRQNICGHIFRRMSYVTAVLCNPLWNVTIVKPLKPLTDTRNTILVMNHLSNADPWICSGAMLPHETKWISKASLFNIPLGGWAMANSGDLKIEFTKEKGGWGTKKGSISKLMDKAKTYLLRGWIVAVYPEGVRNPLPNGPIGEFKLGFFTLAVEMGSTLVPMAVSGTEKMWPLTESFFDCSRAYISFGEPISAVGETAESLRDKTYKVISDLRDKHPDRKGFLQKTA